jgi:RNA polymerase sigma-70 factor (ECF subfamily)
MPPSIGNDRFATTRWSLVLAAKDRAAPEARHALADLCAAYWYPLYAYVRRQGHDAEQAQDLTQEFFAKLLEKDFLRAVDPVKGRFRAFLLSALRHFLANEWDRAKAAKRGGGRTPQSLDFQSAEERYRLEPGHQLTAEKLFERRYALTLLEQVLQRLRQEMVDGGKQKLFEGLKPYLAGAAESSYTETARTLDMSEGAVKTAVHRLRRRYRELLRESIAETVEKESEIDDEIRDLFAALGP